MKYFLPPGCSFSCCIPIYSLSCCSICYHRKHIFLCMHIPCRRYVYRWGCSRYIYKAYTYQYFRHIPKLPTYDKVPYIFRYILGHRCEITLILLYTTRRMYDEFYFMKLRWNPLLSCVWWFLMSHLLLGYSIILVIWQRCGGNYLRGIFEW